MPTRITTKQKALMGIATAGALFVVYDQVVNFGPQSSGAAQQVEVGAVHDANAAATSVSPTPVRVAATRPAGPRVAERLEQLAARMEQEERAQGGARPGAERDIFAAGKAGLRAGVRTTGSDAAPRDAQAREVDEVRAQQLAKVFVLRSVLNHAGGASATVNDVVLRVGRTVRMRVGGESGQEYSVALESVQEPARGERGSAVVRIDGERVTLHIREDARR